MALGWGSAHLAQKIHDHEEKLIESMETEEQRESYRELLKQENVSW